jgi:hypothetical protein
MKMPVAKIKVPFPVILVHVMTSQPYVTAKLPGNDRLFRPGRWEAQAYRPSPDTDGCGRVEPLVRTYPPAESKQDPEGGGEGVKEI